jgi:4-carboxymuconolactone decarboxylase
MMRIVLLFASLLLVTSVVQAKEADLAPNQVGIVTIAALTASGELPKLKSTLNEALDTGLTINEIKEVLVQMYAYTGFPRSLNAINTFSEVVKERQQQGKKDAVGRLPSPLPADKSTVQLGGEIRTRLTGSTAVAEYAKFVPVIDEFLRAHLFGDIFGRDNLDFQSREIATIAALIMLGGVDPQLKAHFNVGLNVGLTRAQLRDIIEVVRTRIDAKSAANAARLLDETLRNRTASTNERTVHAQTNEPTRAELEVLRAGSGPAQQAPPENFSGKVTIELPFRREAPSRLGGATVTFQAGARTAWHIHPLGQTLIVTSGTGWVQREGGPKQEIREGDMVWTPPGVKHWHGANMNGAMTHIAISETLDGSQVTWLEQVSEEEYRR